MTGTCHCLFAHPANDEERAALAADLKNARHTSDLVSVQILLVRLTTAGSCPARRTKGANA
ncbi:hypothetical protein ACFPK5_28850 [Streptomyces beijiangensis]|uniref:hypothetical protein n=1 Tax=Streptomyces beijiangensis TaxID=163361 RepID=UPI0031CFBDC3